MILIFNGPPSSGKDEACLYYKSIGYIHLSFKDELFKETIKYFGVSQDWFMSGYNDRSTKEAPVAELKVDGRMLSRRDAMIYVSEKFIKPKYGKDYFGQKLSESIEEERNYCVSDGGFIEELIPIINNIGAENMAVVQLTRNGCDFSSDSRRYFDGNLVEEFVLKSKTPIMKNHVLPKQFPIRTYRVHNNGSIADFIGALEKIHEKESNVRKINKKKGDSD